jgi:hypothetical protein
VVERVLEGAAEAVELGDDDSIAESALDAFDRCQEERSVDSAAGLVELLQNLLQSAPYSEHQVAMRSCCTAGEMNDAPERPAVSETRT